MRSGLQSYTRTGVLIQPALNLPPTVLVTHMAQDPCQPLVGAIEPLDGLPESPSEGEQPVGYPGLDRHEAVRAPGENGAAPEGADPAQTAPIPGAVRGKMGVNHRRQLQPLHWFEHQRQVVDALRDDVGSRMHAQSVAHSGIYLQIWANR